MDDTTYLFHQTPAELATRLVATLPLEPTDVLYEPFRGEGAFFNAFPAENPREWSEIREGRNYKDHTGEYDWVITNPPFTIDSGAKRVNAFWFFLDYYTSRARKGVAFLANDSCFCTLTPGRIKLLRDRGWYVKNLTVCSIKKWRGRYFFIVLTRTPCDTLGWIDGNF
jgi:hypothetical protein